MLHVVIPEKKGVEANIFLFHLNSFLLKPMRKFLPILLMG